jgi:hypothetical protein
VVFQADQVPDFNGVLCNAGTVPRTKEVAKIDDSLDKLLLINDL